MTELLKNKILEKCNCCTWNSDALRGGTSTRGTGCSMMMGVVVVL